MHIRGNFKTSFVDDINYYRGKCGMCQNYNLNAPSYRGCKCNIHTLKGLAFDDTCSRQRDDRRRSIKEIKKAFEKCRGYDPAIYYIATVIRDTLQTEEAIFYYDLIKEFWQNELEPNGQYQEFLEFYDFCGRLAAKMIKKDNHCQEICQTILANYFVPLGAYIICYEYDKAFEIYQELVNKLRIIYNDNKEQSLEEYQIKRIRRF